MNSKTNSKWNVISRNVFNIQTVLNTKDPIGTLIKQNKKGVHF